MERQQGTTLEKISPDHCNRYRFAAAVIKTGSFILDAACGIGYGSRMMQDAGNVVTGVDIDAGAIAAAYKYYPGPTYKRKDVMLPVCGRFDAVVSFETLEHLPNPERALDAFHTCMPPDGLLIVSVPNQERYPFKAENFANDEYPHLRHYAPEELDELLLVNGFEVNGRWCQASKYSDVSPGTNGMFLVYVSRRR